MQESVRRIIEAEEARMGKDYNTIYLFHKFGERKEQYKSWVVEREKARYRFFISTPNEAQRNCCCACSGEVPL